MLISIRPIVGLTKEKVGLVVFGVGWSFDPFLSWKWSVDIGWIKLRNVIFSYLFQFCVGYNSVWFQLFFLLKFYGLCIDICKTLYYVNIKNRCFWKIKCYDISIGWRNNRRKQKKKKGNTLNKKHFKKLIFIYLNIYLFNNNNTNIFSETFTT